MIPPLRKQNESDGKPYFRPAAVEESLNLLDKLPIEEVARRAAITDKDDAEYLPSECILHFVRRSKANGDTTPYQDLFTALWTRITNAIPVRLRRVAGVSKVTEVDSDGHIQERVLAEFLDLLKLDREDYDERLDYFEVRFNSALHSLKLTSQRKVWTRESRREPIAYDGDGAELSLQMEEALDRVRNPNGQKSEDFLFRIRFLDAIRVLPPDQRRVIELLLEDEYPIDSPKRGEKSIAMILGCSEKTVRNRRDRAYAALREALKEEEVA